MSAKRISPSPELITKLVEEGLTQRQMAKRLNCSQSTVQYWLKKLSLTTKTKMNRVIDRDSLERYTEGQCTTHGITKFVLRSDRNHYTCVKCRYLAVKKRRHKIKRELVNLHGGCCAVCGYSRSMRALHFHHLDPDKKSFNLAANRYVIALEKMKKEIEKCILLCSNCHVEAEEGLITYDALVQFKAKALLKVKPGV